MTKTIRLMHATVVASTLFIVAAAHADDLPTLEWIRQPGTPRGEFFGEAEIDVLGNVFVSEVKHQAFSGDTFRGDYVHKFDPTGSLLWTREIGTSDTIDSITGTWVDGIGNLYVSGTGDPDSYLRKYDPDGNVIWNRQTSQQTGLNSVVGDGLGNLYVAGTTSGAAAGPNAGLTDAILGKYDVNGNLLWMRQFGGTSFDDARSVAPDGRGNVFVSGGTQSSLDGPSAGVRDAYLAKFDGAGNQLWLRQYGGSESDVAQTLATDGQGNIYAQERLGGFWDAANHLTKYDNDGNLLWSRELGGTGGGDTFWGMSADSHGNVYVNGQTIRSLGGPNAGGPDAFLRKYDSEGEILWTFQVGTPQLDLAHANAVDDLGNLVVVGHTQSALAAPFAGGGSDAWVARLRDPAAVPEPTSVGLLIGMLALAGSRARKS